MTELWTNGGSKEDHWDYNQTYCEHKRSHIWSKDKSPSKEKQLQERMKEKKNTSFI
jgi:hypothetical protein